MSTKNSRIAPRHPEDLIFEVKSFINKLSEVQEEKFEQMCRELGIVEQGKDWLFDYVYNCDDGICFDEYLEKYGVKYPECISSPQPLDLKVAKQ